MRVVLLFESPGSDSMASEFGSAAEAFNQGLDIRLRFLDVGFELRSVPVREDGPAPVEELAGTLARLKPGVVLVLGTGLALLECAAVAAKESARLAYLADGVADRTGAALARLARLLVHPAGCAPPPASPDALVHELAPDVPRGQALVDFLVHSVREGRAP